MAPFANASLRIVPNQHLHFVFPAELDDRPSASDSSCEGKVILTLRKAHKVKRVSVRLHGHAEVDIEGSGVVRTTLLDREVILDEGNEKLPAGEHVLHFSLAIPAAAAVYERSAAGRIYHHLKAVAEDLGSFGGDLEASAIIGVIASPSSSGAPPPPLDLEVQENCELGPLRVQLTAQAFTIASLLATSLTLSSPPPDAVIHGVSLHIEQVTTTTGKRGEEDVVTERPLARRRVFRLDRHNPPVHRSESPAPTLSRASGSRQVSPSPPPSRSASRTRLNEMPRCLAELVPGQAYNLRHIARMPHDNVVRPTTLPQTQTPIRHQHELVLELEYSIADLPLRLLSVRREVTLASCACLSDSLVLPEYSVEAVSTKAPKIKKGILQDCLCGQSLQTLLDDQPALLELPAEGADQIPWKAERGRSE